jgi:tetratricopeptide (TPR) repeat protein
MAETGPIRAFLSYAHEDHAWRDRVLKHLGWLRNSGRLEEFDDRQLKPGEAWDDRIQGELREADIVIVLISPDFVGSAYCGLEELLVTTEREKRGQTVVVPILCDHVDLGALPVAQVQCLPQDEQNDLKPLVDWPNFNVPLAVIAGKIRSLVQELEGARPVAAAGAADAPTEVRQEWCLPTPPARCFGRQEERDRIVQALLLDPPDPIIVYGGAGIGKTTLTLDAACHPEVVERFGLRRAFVQLDKALDENAVLAALRAALALPHVPDPWQELESLLEEDLALLVMDSVEVPWERAERSVETVLARLAAIPSVLLLASMRSGNPPVSPSWKLRFELPPLPAPYDRQLLLDIATDVDSGSPALPQALQALDGVPLAIELFAAQAAGQGSLDYAWKQWRTERVGMLDRGGEPDRLSSLAVSLSVSLASPRMNDLARRLYAVLGRLPAGWARESAGQLLPDDVEDAPVRLLRTRLVRFEDGRLRMLGPVREHALGQKLADADDRHLTELLAGLADALPLQQETAADPARAEQARREIANIEAALAGFRAAAPSESHQLGWRWMQVGDTRLTQSVLGSALQAYQSAEQQFSGCVQAEPDQPRWRRSLAASQLRIGDVRRELGEVTLARGAYASAIAVLEGLVAGEPAQSQWQRDLAVARSELADILLAMGDVAGAATTQGTALGTLRALAAASPEDEGAQRDLLVGWAKLGQLSLRQRDPAAALAAHNNAAAIASTQPIKYPGSAEWQRDLSVARLGIGDAHRALGEFPAALAAYGEALNTRERLAAKEGEPYRQYDLAVACERVALTREATGDSSGALAAWRRALAISERVAAAHPDNIDLQLAPVTHLHGIAQVLARGEPAGHQEAVAMLQRAVGILRAAAAADRLDGERSGWIATLETRIAGLIAGANLMTTAPASATNSVG